MEPTELTTERLLLRPFRLEDVDDVYAYAADETWGRFLLQIREPYTRQDAVEFVATALLHSWNKQPEFAVVRNGRLVGGVTLRIDTRRKLAELGYSLNREHWGQGLIPEAARAVIEWAFQSYDIAKVFARADARNTQSFRVMEKLGMQREGQLRKHRHFRGEQVDEVVYGVLREEWPGQPKR